MSTGMMDDAALNYEEEGLFARDFDGQLVRLVEATREDFDRTVTLKIDGQEIVVNQAVPMTDAQGNIVNDSEGRPVPRRTTIYDAATELFVKKQGAANPIPVLCHQEHLRPVGVCRICVVEISQIKRGQRRTERKLLPACQHRVEEGMEVQTIESPDPAARERVRKSVQLLVELLAADHLGNGAIAPDTPNELVALARRFGIGQPRFEPRRLDRGRDPSSSLIAVDHNACILCDRCVRACDEVKQNVVIGRTGKGYSTHIGFDLDAPMGRSTCVSCGECMISCPTDALTLKAHPIPSEVPEDGEAVSPATLKQLHPLFSGIPHKFLEWNAGSVVRRKLQPGAVLCREGEYGNTAFIILRGRFEVAIRTKSAHVENVRARGLKGWLGRITTFAAPGPESAHAGGYGRRVAECTPDNLILGEMTCMSHYPRGATVVAMEESEVLEIRRNVLFMLQRTRSSREILDSVYRRRALAGHLEGVSLFGALPAEERARCTDFLRDKVELVRVDPGQVIFRQGEPADHFYLIRLGFVKVSSASAGQERVLNYLGPGLYFGEIGMLSRLTDVLADRVPSGYRGLRTATCAALDNVELVRIRGEHFRELCQMFPAFREKLLEHATSLLKRDKAVSDALGKPLTEFVRQGLYNAQKLLVLDLEACTRCDECTKACADTHDGVTRLIREGLRFDKYLVASSCRSCMDPYCLVGCPVDAIHRVSSDGGEQSLEIRIENHCIGCGLCAKNCPYGNINMHGFMETRDDPTMPGGKAVVQQQKATTCDLCRHVVRPNEDPSCVYACPHNAAFRMTGPELLQKVDDRRGQVTA